MEILVPWSPTPAKYYLFAASSQKSSGLEVGVIQQGLGLEASLITMLLIKMWLFKLKNTVSPVTLALSKLKIKILSGLKQFESFTFILKWNSYFDIAIAIFCN